MDDVAAECLNPNTPEERLRSLAICGEDEAVNVCLESRAGHSILYIIKIIREHLEIGLKEAMGFLDHLPQVLNQPRQPEVLSSQIPEQLMGLSRERAARLQRELAEYSAQAALQARVFFHPVYSRLVAQNPALSASLVGGLLKSADEETQRHLSQNPALSIRDWFRVAQRHPKEALQNPALPLWLMEDPKLMSGFALPMEVVKVAVQSLDIPPTLGRFFLQNTYFAREVAERATTLPVWLDELSRHSLHTIRQAVARNPRSPVEALQRLAQDPDEKVQEEARLNLAKQGQ